MGEVADMVNEAIPIIGVETIDGYREKPAPSILRSLPTFAIIRLPVSKGKVHGLF
jgi:hypothetical protein